MRILTRGDFDGLVSSVLLTEAENITEFVFVDPKQMQYREVPVTSQDIIVNLPYHPDCGLWFDHHISEQDHGTSEAGFRGKYGLAPSCARLIFEYYRLPQWEKYTELMDAVDKLDSAQLSLNDILRPEGWVRLSNTMDPRTGFPSSTEYFLKMVDWIKKYPIEEIVHFDEVRDRLREFFRRHAEFEELLKKYSRMEGGVVVTDFRNLDKTPLGSRFLIYALFPTANVSVRVFTSRDEPGNVVIALGHSILNRTCKVDVGNLLAEYGGGGHKGAGTCRIPAEEVDDVLIDIIGRLNSQV